MSDINAEEARRRLEDVLKTVGIKLDMFPYADYGYESYIDIEVEFPDGSKFKGDISGLECDGISHRRG
jgi:hypothetical protein